MKRNSENNTRKNSYRTNTNVRTGSNDEIVLIKIISRNKSTLFQENVYKHYGQVNEVSELATKCGYDCIKTFTRHFKKNFNSTPYRWMLDRKMEEVRHLVLETDISITDLADMYGFNDAAHLVNSYTAKFGIPPLKNRIHENRDAV